MSVTETSESIEHAAHGHHHPHETDPFNRRTALVIVILAAMLAIAEMGGKGAQTEALALQVEASNLWTFFQAKTIRMTVLRTAADAVGDLAGTLAPDQATPLRARVDEWRKTAERYDTEPSTGEGRKELSARARQAEATRDHALSAYHLFEFASAALQLAIVLASAATITRVVLLVWGAIGLGAAGLVLAILGWVAPTLVHL